MGIRFGMARLMAAGATWGLKEVLHRPAANFPGKIGLYADAHLIADLRPRIREGAVAVVGTNGKTTVTNLIADTLEMAGKSVACNRTGANLDSGVATALLDAKAADWGVFECDELWLARIAPQLEPDYIVLLNLFRDQLDRVGEIAHTQRSVIAALSSCPHATLIYNCDDPLCQAIADAAGNRRIAFGIAHDLGLAQDTVSDAGMCQRCESLLDYEWRQYGQLGSYTCRTCGFTRDEPAYTADEARIAADGMQFVLRGGSVDFRVDEALSGPYMIYNMLAAYAVADCCHAPFAALARAARTFDPRNGRLQRYDIDGCKVLLNLAKNPTGFNQNLRIIMQAPGPKAVAFFINDKEADGHDVSWLWDVDFQRLAGKSDLFAFAGGIRRDDMRVRLKYAGIQAELVDGVRDFLARARGANTACDCYVIANYTALPRVKRELDRMQERQSLPAAASSATRAAPREAAAAPPEYGAATPQTTCDLELGTDALAAAYSPAPAPAVPQATCGSASAPAAAPSATRAPTLRAAVPQSRLDAKLTIVHLYPALLNLYGDGGNVTVLSDRALRRSMRVTVERVEQESEMDLTAADIVFVGGGPDREQRLAAQRLARQADALRAYVEDDGVMLAICGGLQIIGKEWVLGDETVAGLGLIDAITCRAEGGSYNRLVGNVVLKSPLAHMPVVGYENHAGRTFLGARCEPFGRVTGTGHGSNGADGTDGALYRNVVGTYLHGPLLSKNPEIADWLIERALKRRARIEGRPFEPLSPLDDAAEQAANGFMCRKMGAR